MFYFTFFQTTIWLTVTQPRLHARKMRGSTEFTQRHTDGDPEYSPAL